MRLSGCAAFAVLVLSLAAAPAPANHVRCGDVITQSTTLDSDLSNCPGNGISVAGAGITLDLDGHTVDGTGSGTGVRDAGCEVLGCPRSDNLTIRNGIVRDFRDGVRVDRVTGLLVEHVTAAYNYYQGVAVTDSVAPVVRHVLAYYNPYGSGINLSSLDNAVIVDNEAYKNGAGMGGGAVRDSVIARNEIEDSEFGGLGFQPIQRSRIADNRISDNGSYGLLLTNTSEFNHVVGNQVVGSGTDGIVLDEDGSLRNVLERNTVSRSGDDGIDVDYPLNTLTRNTTTHNGDLGIEAIAGTIDGGKNKARANGNPAECTGVSCK